jgi:hypothetical protein
MADFLLGAWFVAIAISPAVLRGILRARSRTGRL